MPKTDHYVYLLPQRGEGNAVSWTWLYKGQFGPASNFPTIEAKNGSGSNDIYFTVVDMNGAIKFAGFQTEDQEAAIAIGVKKPGVPKPKKGIDSDGQIKEIAFQQTGTQLKLDNINSKKAELVYTLHFVDSATNTPVTSIDPDLKNGGGGGGGDQLNFSALETAGIAVGVAVVTALLTRWAQRRGGSGLPS